ncbi:Rho3 GTP binding protein [Violaceomyces palustris]|uniref:Rho3 GTP binding protein n=1 Tax=Violaceomyces palustris TaxID=1673888 RepID=A0ACD0NYK6_9BASI|nr:Rho3 GTP binding protein [Violaceomyces palustris]
MASLCGSSSTGARIVARKVLVLGDGACGKTSLLNVFIRGYFPQVYEPTVFENYVQTLTLDTGVTVELSLWDTAGQEEFDKLRSLSYADTHIIMLCFSADNPISLENVESRWMDEIAEHCPGVKIVLIALKCDLRDDQAVQEKLARSGDSPLTYEKGLQVARRIKATRYLECSAKFNRGVSEAFNEAAKVAAGAKAKGKDGTGGGGCVIS